MHQRSMALLAFGLGMMATPVIAILVHQTTEIAIARDEDDSGFGRSIEKPELSEPINDDDIGAVVAQPDNEGLDPKQVYLDLVKSKISLMTPEELQRATDTLRGELFEMQATEKLRATKRQLEELIEQHPETAAARIARQMLRSLDVPLEHPQRREPFDDSDQFRTPQRPASSREAEPVQPRRKGTERDGANFRRGFVPEVPNPDDEAR